MHRWNPAAAIPLVGMPTPSPPPLTQDSQKLERPPCCRTGPSPGALLRGGEADLGTECVGRGWSWAALTPSSTMLVSAKHSGAQYFLTVTNYTVLPRFPDCNLPLKLLGKRIFPLPSDLIFHLLLLVFCVFKYCIYIVFLLLVSFCKNGFCFVLYLWK